MLEQLLAQLDSRDERTIPDQNLQRSHLALVSPPHLPTHVRKRDYIDSNVFALTFSAITVNLFSLRLTVVTRLNRSIDFHFETSYCQHYGI